MMKLLILVASIGICVIAAPESQIRFTRDGTSGLFTVSENKTKQLVENGQNISEADLGGISIHLAAKKGLEITVQLLIHHKSNASAKDKDGNSALHLAASEGHDRVVQILLEHESDVNAIDSNEDTPLHLAARRGHDTVAKRLIAYGSNVSATNSYGETPLHLAADYGHYEVVKRLIDHGSNVSAINSNGDTPFHWAARLGNNKVFQLLLDKGSNFLVTNNKGNTALHLAAFWGDYQTIKQLIELGSNVSATNNEGNTPMHLAATGGHDIVVQLLIEHGSNVSAVNNDGNTALHLAASGGHYKVVELFWKKGANLHIKNGSGEEPLSMAKKRYTTLHRYLPGTAEDHENVVNLLENAISRENKIQNLIEACDYYSMETPDYYIYNRNKNELGEFPWMAVLIYLEKHEIKIRFKCGGTIISEQYLLTAAHCVETDNRPFAVRLGGVRLDDRNAINYEIKEINLHPNYSKAYGKNPKRKQKIENNPQAILDLSLRSTHRR